MRYEIEIEGLPEGWKPVRFGKPRPCIDLIFVKKEIQMAHDYHSDIYVLIVEKIKPRRIVLEETKEDNETLKQTLYATQFFFNKDISMYNQPKIWREVTENEEQK